MFANFILDPEMCSIFCVLENGFGVFFHDILCMIFQEKFFSSYILLIDQISLLNMFYVIFWVINFETNHIFQIKVGFPPSKKKLFYILQWKPFENDEYFSLSRYITFCLDFLVM